MDMTMGKIEGKIEVNRDNSKCKNGKLYGVDHDKWKDRM